MIRNIQYNSLEDFIKELFKYAYSSTDDEEAWNNGMGDELDDFIKFIYSNPDFNKYWEPLLNP